jgi:hypothetical protein
VLACERKSALGAFAGEFVRDGAAKSFAGRRDDYHPACDSQIHSGSSINTLIASRNV